MANGSTADDEAARKARADAIRRARDLRNAGLDTPAAEAPDGAGADGGGDPNYVDLIDRKMKEREDD